MYILNHNSRVHKDFSLRITDYKLYVILILIFQVQNKKKHVVLTIIKHIIMHIFTLYYYYTCAHWLSSNNLDFF